MVEKISARHIFYRMLANYFNENPTLDVDVLDLTSYMDVGDDYVVVIPEGKDGIEINNNPDIIKAAKLVQLEERLNPDKYRERNEVLRTLYGRRLVFGENIEEPTSWSDFLLQRADYSQNDLDSELNRINIDYPDVDSQIKDEVGYIIMEMAKVMDTGIYNQDIEGMTPEELMRIDVYNQVIEGMTPEELIGIAAQLSIAENPKIALSAHDGRTVMVVPEFAQYETTFKDRVVDYSS